MSDYDFSSYEEEWDTFEPQESTGDFGPVIPDGQHQALLVDMQLRTRESDGARSLYLKWTNRLGSVRQWWDFDHEVGRSKIMNALHTLGFEPPDASRWEAAVSFIEVTADAGIVCQIGVKTKPGDTRDFIDVYLNGVVGTASDPEEWKPLGGVVAAQATHAPVPADDDIPF